MARGSSSIQVVWGSREIQIPRAAYAFLDTEKLTFEHKRVEYPVEVTQEKMRQYGIPARLIRRLEYGW